MSRLVARIEHVGRVDDLDLVAEAGPNGFLHQTDTGGWAARGVAARIDLPGGLADPGTPDLVADVLAGIGAEGDARALAVGSFPFDRHGPAHLVVPEVAVRVDRQGRVTVTTVSRDEPDRWRPVSPPPSGDEADGFSLRPDPPHRAFRELVDRAVKAIADGDLRKVVVARTVLVEANRPIDRSVVLRRLRDLYPSCVTFAVDGFVGASPEQLVARQGDDVLAHPLAGTVPRSGDPEHDRKVEAEMLASTKQRWEHALTVDFVATQLQRHCAELHVPEAPSIVELRNVSHLGTAIRGRLRHTDASPPPSALALAAALHPTPAVGGSPHTAAMRFLTAHEGIERNRYAGPVGWVDTAGDGEWTVGIRSAQLDGQRATLYSGVGIVEGSDADAELAETQFKLQALLASLVRP